MEKILKAIPQKLEPTGLFLTDAERVCIAEALCKAGIQRKSETAKEIFDQLEPKMFPAKTQFATVMVVGYRALKKIREQYMEEQNNDEEWAD